MMMVVLMTVLVIMYVTALAHLVLMLVMMMFVYHMQFLLISAAKVRGPSCNRVANSTIIDYFCSR